MIEKGEVRRLILGLCQQLELDPWIVEAIVWKESNYKSDAIRFEPRFYKRYIVKLSRERLKSWNPGVGTDVSELFERFSCAVSWGLCQIMGVVARENGYRGVSLEGLLMPDVNLSYGCRIVQGLLKKYPLEQAISAYNAGSPTLHKTKSNRKYVNAVLKKIWKLKRLEENHV